MAPPNEDTPSGLTIATEPSSSFRASAKVFAVGILMGSADAVPGISGGTVALITGIYGRLIAAITAITPSRFLDLLRAILPLDSGISRHRVGVILREFDAVFVATLLTGIATAVVIVGRIVGFAAARTPVLLFGFLFGLIAASAVILWRELSMNTTGQWLAAFVGFAIAFVLSGDMQVLEGGGLAVVFIAGAVAVSAMILPGISGSLLLVILGQYIPMYESLNSFLDGIGGVVTGGEFEAVVAPGRDVFTLLLGGLIGLFTVARLIRRLLDKNREATLAFLVALVFGALRAPISELSATEGVAWTMATVGEFGGLALVGAVLVLGLDWYAIDLDFGSL
jgi:putative membrane protein